MRRLSQTTASYTTARDSTEGIGRRLLGDLIEASVAEGFRALSLSVAENNPARRLYESVGFVPVHKHGHTYTMVRQTSSPGDVTLATYEARANVYRDHEGPRPPALEAFLDRLASLVPGGRALEVGSGTGSDADRLEELGLQVERTDATPAFIEMQREAGHRARLLDARRDELGGPFDAVLSIATLHHLTREELESFLAKARAAVPRGGVLAVTLKEGDGGAWSDAKLGQPRYFVYWREPNLRDMVTRAGWKVLSLDHIEGREPWLFLLARRDDVDDLAPSDT